jgi:hypothetical protein
MGKEVGTETGKASPRIDASSGDAEGVDGRRLTTMDRVYGAVGVAAVLLALFFLVRGGAKDDGSARPAAVPRLVIVDPAAGAEVEQPVTVTFDAGTELAPDGGDPRAGRHVHVRAGPSELMAAIGDVKPVSGTRYRWTLPRLPAGTHALQLYWSDARHRPLAEGASDSVVVRLR